MYCKASVSQFWMTLNANLGLDLSKIPLEKPWKRHSETLIFKIPLDAPALEKRVPLVRVPKPPTIHYQPAT